MGRCEATRRRWFKGVFGCISGSSRWSSKNGTTVPRLLPSGDLSIRILFECRRRAWISSSRTSRAASLSRGWEPSKCRYSWPTVTAIPTILPSYSYLLTGLLPDAKLKIYPDAAHGFPVPASQRIRGGHERVLELLKGGNSAIGTKASALVLSQRAEYPLALRCGPDRALESLGKGLFDELKAQPIVLAEAPRSRAGPRICPQLRTFGPAARRWRHCRRPRTG